MSANIKASCCSIIKDLDMHVKQKSMCSSISYFPYSDVLLMCRSSAARLWVEPINALQLSCAFTVQRFFDRKWSLARFAPMAKSQVLKEDLPWKVSNF